MTDKYVRLNLALDEVLQGPQNIPQNYDNVSRFDLLSDERKVDYLWFPYEESVPDLTDFEEKVFSNYDFGSLPTKVIGIYTKQTKTNEQINTINRNKQFQDITLDTVDWNFLIVDIWNNVISATTLADNDLRPVNRKIIQKLRSGAEELKRLKIDKYRELNV